MAHIKNALKATKFFRNLKCFNMRRKRKKFPARGNEQKSTILINRKKIYDLFEDEHFFI